MAAKKSAPLNKSEKARIAGRKQSVKTGVAKGLSPYEARKRYYVQTRVAELEKAGKPVSAEKRKQLRQNFNSGNVSRRGFAAPKKKPKAIESPKTSPVVKPSVPSGGGYGRTENRPSSSSTSTSSKKGRSGGGKVYDFARNELLGVDDFGRVGKNLRKGNYGKALKSAGSGVIELASTLGGGGLPNLLRANLIALDKTAPKNNKRPGSLAAKGKSRKK